MKISIDITPKPSTPLLVGIAGLILIGAPLAGAWLAGLSLKDYLELPPRPVRAPVPGFSWAMFWLMAAFILAVVAPLAWRFLSARSVARSSEAAHTTPIPAFPLRGQELMSIAFPLREKESPSLRQTTKRRDFPIWGWAALLWLAASSMLAWTRFSWFEPFQPHTFTPLWLGYIGVVNALTVWRAGNSLLTREPLRFAALFPLSALFWWFFEYLNRFVGNWHYAGIEDFSALQYTFFATLAFSIVLPAVASTAEWLGTFERLDAAFARWFPVCVPRPKLVAAVVLVVMTLSLAGLGVFREHLFPLVWISPLLVIVSLQALGGRATVLSPLRRGDWRSLMTYAVGALVCGFFWEMWNYGSLAHWEYGIPYVDRFRIFEMPLLGYAGYLPFGIECAAIAALVLDRD